MDRRNPVSRVTARVAMVWDWESFWPQDLDWRPSVDLSHRGQIESWYTALWRRGVTVDFVHPEHDLTGFDLVLLPSLYLTSAAAGRNLTAFVSVGGRLAVSFFSGIVDEHDAVHAGGYPGPLREVLGLQVQEFLPFLEGESAPIAFEDPDRAGPGGATGQGETALTGSVWADDIVGKGAVPVARFAAGRAQGQPALTRNSYGPGAAWYVATQLDPHGLDLVIERLLADAGIDQHPLLPVGLETVVRHDEQREYRFWLNHSDRDHRVPADGTELLTGTVITGSLTVPAGTVRVVATAVGF